MQVSFWFDASFSSVSLHFPPFLQLSFLLYFSFLFFLLSRFLFLLSLLILFVLFYSYFSRDSSPSSFFLLHLLVFSLSFSLSFSFSFSPSPSFPIPLPYPSPRPSSPSPSLPKLSTPSHSGSSFITLNNYSRGRCRQPLSSKPSSLSLSPFPPFSGAPSIPGTSSLTPQYRLPVLSSPRPPLKKSTASLCGSASRGSPITVCNQLRARRVCSGRGTYPTYIHVDIIICGC